MVRAAFQVNCTVTPPYQILRIDWNMKPWHFNCHMGCTLLTAERTASMDHTINALLVRKK